MSGAEITNENHSNSINRKPATKNKLKVIELFAGVGGFRIALEGYPKKKEADFEVVWSNQFEPRTKKQHANIVYKNRFGSKHNSEEDIEHIVKNKMHCIPKHDLLVGGFPCQDFSIANRSHNKGIEGKKGKLWWSIQAILKANQPSYILLENVDRLLTSLAGQNGKDFEVILHCLNAIEFAVEWRVINAADYGFPQRRRRVFILGFHKNTSLYRTLKTSKISDWITKTSIATKAFPVDSNEQIKVGILPTSIENLLQKKDTNIFRLEKARVMLHGAYCSLKVTPKNV
ncbi:DNA (cytosine-5-)-methyltransferase [Polaribacter sp. Z022]|uniref:DNA cytosine methyltransferase n=1 Tax=Polaribacter sp. Z022 TaxID=2927125 RepID=UPI002021B0FF|nr:DNA (cytosine-5-)-methyltransferase [Polaribacter sp. Z022]MCL7753086.1 DNA (cytosine-5-)-methyltransferase [Polaribacter sp. Z022]